MNHMRTALSGVILILSAVANVIGQANQKAIQDQVLAAENARVEMLHRGESRVQFVTKDYLGYNRTGEVGTANLNRTSDPKFTIEDVTVRALSAVAAVATGIQHPQGTKDQIRFVRLWVKEAGQWKVTAFQGVAVTNETGDKAAISPIKELKPKRITPATSDAGTLLNADQAFIQLQSQTVKRAAMQTKDYLSITRTGGKLESNPANPPKPLKSVMADYDRVQTFGTVGVVQGTMVWTDSDGFSPGALRFTRIWVKQGADWKVSVEYRTALLTEGSGMVQLRGQFRKPCFWTSRSMMCETGELSAIGFPPGANLDETCTTSANRPLARLTNIPWL